MGNLGKLEYVEVEFLAEWMGNLEGSKRVVLKSHAEYLMERDPAPIDILRYISVVNGKVVEEVEEPEICEDCGELVEECTCEGEENTLEDLVALGRESLDIMAKGEPYNLEYHHACGDITVAQKILDKCKELEEN